jgi:hypothetical protein
MSLFWISVCHYGECHYSKCQFTECRGTITLLYEKKTFNIAIRKKTFNIAKLFHGVCLILEIKTSTEPWALDYKTFYSSK